MWQKSRYNREADQHRIAGGTYPLALRLILTLY
jgi:hypothetical protein